MNNITVDILFPDGTKNRGNGKLDIDSLFKGTPQLTNKKEDFTSSDLLSSIENNRKKKLKVMIEQYNLCCKTIKSTDSDGNDYTMFTVPQSVPECSTYSSVDALEYISENLRSKFIDTLIVNDTSLFITWKDLELKLELKREKEELERKNKEKDQESSDE